MRAIPILLTLAAALASDSATLEPSPARTIHPVGVSIVRVGDAPFQPHGLRIAVWRPIVEQTTTITIGELASIVCPQSPGLADCFPDLSRETGLPNGKVLSAGELRRLATQDLGAAEGGTPAAGRFPLVVFAGSIQSRGGEFIELARALAGHGFIAAVMVRADRGSRPAFNDAEVELARSDLAAVLRTMQQSAAGPNQLGVVSWSFGGVSATLEAMHNAAIRGLVSLDAALIHQYGVELIRTSASYRPLGYSGEVLSITAGVRGSATRDDSVLRAMTNARIENVVAQGLRHGDFSDLYTALPALLLSPAERSRLPGAHRVDVFEQVERFLRRALGQEP